MTSTEQAPGCKALSSYKGFDVSWDEKKQKFAISLEGQPVSHAEQRHIAEQLIDFFHDASSVSFAINRRRAEQAAPGRPEPELKKNGRMNIDWVRWYRDVSGCGLRDAHNEAVRRMGN